jgi:hypothetical protein
MIAKTEDYRTVEYRSSKSKSRFIAKGTPSRAFLSVTGEAATNSKVQKTVSQIRVQGADFATADWTARMLARTY